MEDEKPPGVLLIHGLGTNHSSMVKIANLLENQNFIVDNADLPGHNTTPEDLKNTEWIEWTNQTQKRLESLRVKSSKVFILGASLGSVISLYLATKNPDVDGLILCSTALKPFNFKSWVVYNFHFIQHFIRYVPLNKIVSMYLGIPKDWKRYEKLPVSSLIQGAKLLKELRKRIKQVKQPILIIQAKNDRIINLRGRKQVFNAVSSVDKTLVELLGGGHVIMSDENCQQAFDKITKWLQERSSDLG
ncbi:MAG: alpha/beta hydrolase [Candidatus Thorarchaeota archaeon]